MTTLLRCITAGKVLKMGPIGFTETSVSNYQSTQRKSPEHRSGSPQQHTSYLTRNGAPQFRQRDGSGRICDGSLQLENGASIATCEIRPVATLSGIAGSSPAKYIDACLLCVACCLVAVCATCRSLIQRIPAELCVCRFDQIQQ